MVFREEIIKNFMLRAKKGLENKGGTNKFKESDVLINCWIAFEAFSCEKYKKDWVQDRIDDFCSTFGQNYKENYDILSETLRNSVKELGKRKFGDMRPSHLTDAPKEIGDVKDLSQVMKVIYQVRNNLFHGGKNPAGNEDDFEKVSFSANAFYFILEWSFSKEGLSW